MTTLPPSFPVEPTTDTTEVLLKKLKTRITEKFRNFPQETSPNRVSVGQPSVLHTESIYYIPHNYRLIFPFNKTSFNPTEPRVNQGSVRQEKCNQVLGFKIDDTKTMNHGSTTFYKFDNASVWVRKDTIEICTKINHKKAYSISFSTNADQEILSILHEKDAECKEILQTFINKYGGQSDFSILKRTSEDKVFGDRALDSMDPNMRFRNEVAKKVYHDNCIEFAGPEYTSNYIKNRAIESIAPEIAGELQRIQALSQSVLSMMRTTAQINQQTAELLFELAKKELKKTEPENQKGLFDYVR